MTLSRSEKTSVCANAHCGRSRSAKQPIRAQLCNPSCPPRQRCKNAQYRLGTSKHNEGAEGRKCTRIRPIHPASMLPRKILDQKLGIQMKKGVWVSKHHQRLLKRRCVTSFGHSWLISSVHSPFLATTRIDARVGCVLDCHAGLHAWVALARILLYVCGSAP